MGQSERAALRAELKKLQATTAGKATEDPADDAQHERVHAAEKKVNVAEATWVRATTR